MSAITRHYLCRPSLANKLTPWSDEASNTRSGRIHSCLPERGVLLGTFDWAWRVQSEMLPSPFDLGKYLRHNVVLYSMG